MEASEKEEIRARTDIVELIGGYTALRQAGRSYKGLCPFHQEKTPSFVVNPEKGLWRCYGACQTGGDVFSFVEKAEGLSFPEAAERLARRAGVTLTPRGRDREEAERVRSERDLIYAANAAAVRFFREAYSRATLAQEYARKRGLAHETLEDFGIGYAPDDWSQLADYLKRNGVHLADAEKAGLVGASRRGDGTYIDKFRGRLIFPIHDLQERVVAFGGRLLLPAENAPKYLNTPETPLFSKSKTLYGLARARDAIKERDVVVIVEGYMDVVACHQAGIKNVVAILGTSLTEEHTRLIRRFTKNIVISLDSDEAGIRAALRAAELIRSVGEDMSLRILALPASEDPDSLIAKGGSGGFLKAVDAAVTVAEFEIDKKVKAFDISSESGRAACIREVVQVIGKVHDTLDRDRLIQQYAHRLHPAGGAYAEQSMRDAVQAYRSGTRAEYSGGYIPDAPPASGPPVPLRGQPVTRVRGGAFNKGRSGSGGGSAGPTDGRQQSYPPQQQHRSFGQQPYSPRSNGGNGYGGYRQYGAAPPALPEVAPSPASQRTAAEKAEQTLIQAFLSDEWSSSLRDRLHPEHFTDPLTARLVEALLPLVSGGYSPTDAIAQLTDDLLRDHAESLALSDEDGGEVTPAVLADCLRSLETRRKQSEINEIRAALSSDAEGNPDPDDELLRRWAQKARALKARDEGRE